MISLVIPHVKVESSAMLSAGYTERHGGLLEIQWKTSGKLYRYHTVSRQVFENLIKAPSKTRYFNAVIKGRYVAKLVATRAKGAPEKSK